MVSFELLGKHANEGKVVLNTVVDLPQKNLLFSEKPSGLIPESVESFSKSFICGKVGIYQSLVDLVSGLCSLHSF